MFKQTSNIIKSYGLARPTLVVCEARARNNIRRMAAKARASGVTLRPHFKTHQSVAIGSWFATEDIDRITVSSVAMAERFAAAGWRDITLAILLNPLELAAIRTLAGDLAARKGRLGITIDSVAAAQALHGLSGSPPVVWLKIDTGYHRTGIPWDAVPLLKDIAGHLQHPPIGLLTHAGYSYHTQGQNKLNMIWEETVQRLDTARASLNQPSLLLSVGDTPTCSSVSDLSGVNEIRPGNFVYNDLMQVRIGSCGSEDLAAAVACPVVGIYPQRHQVVIHGGAVHLSKEVQKEHGQEIFGKLGLLQPGRVLDGAILTGLSQEHGIITFAPGAFPAPGSLEIGDMVLVWPVHSCLAANLLGEPTILP